MASGLQGYCLSHDFALSIAPLFAYDRPFSSRALRRLEVVCGEGLSNVEVTANCVAIRACAYGT